MSRYFRAYIIACIALAVALVAGMAHAAPAAQPLNPQQAATRAAICNMFNQRANAPLPVSAQAAAAVCPAVGV